MFFRRGRKRAADGVRGRLARAAFAHATEFMVLLDREGRVLAANPTALALGGKADGVRGQPFWEARWWAHSATLAAEIRTAFRTAAAGGLARLEAVLPGGGSAPRYFDMSLRGVGSSRR